MRKSRRSSGLVLAGFTHFSLSAARRPATAQLLRPRRRPARHELRHRIVFAEDDLDVAHEFNRLAYRTGILRFDFLAAVRKQEGTIGIAQRRGVGGGFCHFQKGEHFDVGCAVRQAVFRGENVGEPVKAEGIRTCKPWLPASKFSGGNSFSSGICVVPGGLAATNCRASPASPPSLVPSASPLRPRCSSAR